MYSVIKRVIKAREIIFIYRIFSVYDYPKCSTYKHTIFLPKTKFPHKVSSVNRRERDHRIENVRHSFHFNISFLSYKRLYLILNDSYFDYNSITTITTHLKWNLILSFYVIYLCKLCHFCFFSIRRCI